MIFYKRSLLLLVAATGFLAIAMAATPSADANSPTGLLSAMSGELNRAMSALTQSGSGQQPPYYISYDAHEVMDLRLVAQYGAILTDSETRRRTADIIVRVGDPQLDNTHGTHHASAIHSVELPLSDDSKAIQRALWWGTNTEYGNALTTYSKVKSEANVGTKDEDKSPDFSKQEGVHVQGKLMEAPVIDRAVWEKRLRSLSVIFRAYPHINSNLIALSLSGQNNFFVSSEGSQVVTGEQQARIVVLAQSRADDGMELSLVRTFEGRTDHDLPSDAELEKQVRLVAVDLDKLRSAEPAEPYNGPALMSGRAAAVFFHEVLGHRLEGQRQRGNTEGQTFTKDVGKPILPSFLSVVDDPTLASFGGVNLAGFYNYDDEGQPAKKVDLIHDGVLQQFLMSRMPIAKFAESNGHGRAQNGHMPTGRQGNLIVSSSKTVSDAELRKLLIAEIKKQNKAYGLYFEDIASGFTLTQRVTPQAFEVVPLVVYRVYADGRPDELVRGVNIVGTPQAALTRIVTTGNKPDVFNGECGAESGMVPVSAIAPAMLFSEIETQKAAQGSARPPILPPPTAEPSKELQ